MRKISRCFLFTFFIIILSLPVYWLLGGKPASQVSIVEGRVLALPEKSYPTLQIALDYIREGQLGDAFTLVWNLYTGGSLQRKFDAAATDQFPLRMPLIHFSKAFDRQTISLAYAFSNDAVVSADMTSNIYIIPNEEALIFPPGILDQQGYTNMDERLINYDQISSLYPNINFNIYYVETLAYSQVHPLNRYFANADKGQAIEYFKSNLTDRIELGVMPLDGMKDQLANFYRTDHHWNIYGILEAYNGIYELLKQNFVNISEKFTPDELYTFPDIEFLGSLARKTLYPITGDPFTVYIGELANCIVSDNGIEGKYDCRDEYLVGNYQTTPYLDHYELFFSTQTGLLEYNCETTTNRSILVIGDSYSRPLIPLIAQHYQQTFFVDLRQVPEFTLSNFLDDHSVEDVLVVGDYEVVFIDTEVWSIHP